LLLKAQTIEGVKIQESLRCSPDNPYDIAAEVKGTNNISMEALMNTHYAMDGIIKKNDMDGDGDPDLIIIKLEVAELNGHSPDFAGFVPTFDIAPGIQPGMWVFAPKFHKFCFAPAGQTCHLFVAHRHYLHPNCPPRGDLYRANESYVENNGYSRY
jgi:hypothetical protein